MLVFDRGYADYGWFQRLTGEGVYFVTRLEDNATHLLMEERQPAGDGVVCDEIIVLEKQASSERAPFLRRVRYWDASTQRELVFLTNHLDLAAATVAAIYKQRWQIGVSSQGHIVQSVRDRPGSIDDSYFSRP